MKQAIKFVDEIVEQYKAFYNATSPKIKEDRAKHIKDMKHELKFYCKFKNLDYIFMERIIKKKINTQITTKTNA